MSSVALILPAYNEELTVAAVISEFHSTIPEAEIYVVNNGSTDETAARAEATLSELVCRGRVIDEPLRGKGNAIRRAFQEIDADVYVLVDADMSYPASEARALIAPILEGEADMVVGDRLSAGDYLRENDRRFHTFGNDIVAMLVNVLFRARLIDVMSGFRAFSAMFVRNYPVLVEGFEIEADMTLHALHHRMRIMEVPIRYRRRPEGSVSKLNTFSDGARILFTIAQVLRYYRPLVFFGTLAALLALAGVLAAIPVFEDWIRSRYIYHVPLAILASALEIVATMALGIGLVLDSVAHQRMQDFEQRVLGSRRSA